MKTYLLIAMLIIVSATINAQKKVEFGLRAGLNMQNINGKDITGDKLDLNLVPRFHAGIVAGILVAPDFYFQPGLFFTTKGAKSENEFLGIDMSVKYNLSYVEVPMSFVYKPVLGNGRFFIGLGPYVGYGVSGKAQFEVGSISTEEDIVFGKDFSALSPSDWKYFRALDYGGNLFFGYEMSNRISLQLNTQLGLAKINADNTAIPENETEFRNTGFGFSVGYNF